VIWVECKLSELPGIIARYGWYYTESRLRVIKTEHDDHFLKYAPQKSYFARSQGWTFWEGCREDSTQR